MSRGQSRRLIVLGVLTTLSQGDIVTNDLVRHRSGWHLGLHVLAFVVLAGITLMFLRDWWTSDAPADD